ncbi:ABC transporter substrate-binding protein [Ectothiorhodospiraceae bacterium WFHF3C12]|nr:ABC transporter substrate-binding protein [Ectothiorhodospiraceae bacterium WFHF3C12]
MKGMLRTAALTLLAIPALAAGQDDTIKIGAIATLEGAFATLGQDGIRGVKMALEAHDYEIGGKSIELITESSDASPDSAVQAARKLVENDEVDIVIGPLSGSEGIALRDYSKTQPQVTFFNGASAAQSTTLRESSENFFRFSTDGAQWMAGLGEYVYEEKGWERVAVVAEDYSFPYTQVMGFLLDYCSRGGSVAERFWVPIGNSDYSSIVYSIPQDIDAIYVALGGSDAVNFLTQYQQAGGQKPMIGGSITVDQSVLSAKGLGRDYLAGTPSAGPIADNWQNEDWRAFVERYQDTFPDGLPSPSLFAHGYYVNTLAATTALAEVDGELGDHQRYREVVSNLELDTPTGTVYLDENRQAVADIFVTEVAQNEDGSLYNKVVEVVPEVNQTLGRDRDEFMELGKPSRTNPPCN